MIKSTQYPTMEQVAAADRVQLARWYRFLSSPGQNHLDLLHSSGAITEAFSTVRDNEVLVMNQICERFNAMGGFTPEISKQIGWK